MAMNNVLIASDFSKHANYALQRAISLAEQHKSILNFLHILKQPWIGSFAQLPINELQQNYFSVKKKTERKLLTLLKKYSHAIETHVSVLPGRAADEIVRFAKENQCELIVAGAHGHYYINNYVLGTTSGAIIEQSHIPILLVKKEPVFAYDRILIATDFSEVSKEAVEFTFNCFPEASFQLLHILDIFGRKILDTGDQDENSIGSENHPTKDIIETLDDFLKKCNVDNKKFQKKIIGGYFADSIITESEKWRANLISFGTQGNSRLHYLLMGSVAKRILHLSTTDMLAVPAKQH